MDALQFEKWKDKNGKQEENKQINGINYKFVKMFDSWIAIFKNIENIEYIPLIQAKTEKHAINYCITKENTNFKINKLI